MAFTANGRAAGHQETSRSTQGPQRTQRTNSISLRLSRPLRSSVAAVHSDAAWRNRHTIVTSLSYAEPMPTPSVLLVVADATRHCSVLLHRIASQTGFQAVGPLGAIAALRYCAAASPSVALVHSALRDITGPELCQLLRGRPRTRKLPILLFDTQASHAAAPRGALAFADAFLSREELPNVAARVQALLHPRKGQRNGAGLLSMYEGRHLSANFQRVSLSVEGERVDLTRRELRLLQFLVTHRNHVLTRDDLLAHVWDGGNDGRSRTVDVHIRRLRTKLGPAARQIQTLTGVGYRFSED
jgi:two-component system phosphate regulon response regulator PhoB